MNKQNKIENKLRYREQIDDCQIGGHGGWGERVKKVKKYKMPV